MWEVRRGRRGEGRGAQRPGEEEDFHAQEATWRKGMRRGGICVTEDDRGLAITLGDKEVALSRAVFAARKGQEAGGM